MLLLVTSVDGDGEVVVIVLSAIVPVVSVLMLIVESVMTEVESGEAVDDAAVNVWSLTIILFRLFRCT